MKECRAQNVIHFRVLQISRLVSFAVAVRKSSSFTPYYNNLCIRHTYTMHTRYQPIATVATGNANSFVKTLDPPVPTRYTRVHFTICIPYHVYRLHCGNNYYDDRALFITVCSLYVLMHNIYYAYYVSADSLTGAIRYEVCVCVCLQVSYNMYMCKIREAYLN